jgi:hypothetical protein
VDSQAYLAKLKSSGLSSQDAAKLGFEPLSREQLVKRYPDLTQYPLSGFQIPYYDLQGKLIRDFFRFRFLEQPERSGFDALTAPRKPIRYVQPKDVLPRVYFPRTHRWSDHFKPGARVFITEGELKAACGIKFGIPTIGLGGVFNFRSAAGNEPFIRDLATLPWEDVTAYVCYDSDAQTNPNVLRAENMLARELTNRKADVYICRFPSDPGTKVGLDDYLVEYGDERFVEEVMQTAEQWTVGKALREFNEEVCYVFNHSIYDIARGVKIRREAFVNETHVTRVYSVQEVDKDNNVKLVPKSLAKEWIKWPGRAELPCYVYRPGEPLLSPEGVNEWKGWGIADELVVKPSRDNEVIRLWDELLDVVFGSSREWFERWLAAPIQAPGLKQQTAVLIWSRTRGLGKDLIGRIMGALYGSAYAHLEDSDLYKNFNQFLENKSFGHIEEIAATSGDSRLVVAARLKKLITQATKKIEPKFLDAYWTEDCVNYYATSNEPNALYIEPDDRRWFVVESRNGRKPQSFYDRWIGLLKTPNALAPLMYRLRHLPMGDFNPSAPAPVTEAKLSMVDAGLNDFAAWVYELRTNPDSVLRLGDHVVTHALVTDQQLLAFCTSRFPNTNRRLLITELKRQGFAQACNGSQIQYLPPQYGKPRLWIVRDAETLVKAKEKTIRERFLAERADELAVNGRKK